MLQKLKYLACAFMVCLFGLTLIPAPIVIAQQADDMVVETIVKTCQPVTKVEIQEVCHQQPIKKWNKKKQKMITKMKTVCTKRQVAVTDQVCTHIPVPNTQPDELMINMEN